MYLIKGLLIFSPFLVYGLRVFDWTWDKEKLITSVLGILLLIVIFSPFSFSGWLVDFILFFFTAVLTLRSFATKWTKTSIVMIQIIATLLLVGYVGGGSLFGRQLIDKYEKGRLTFRLYEIPDMVLAPTHRLQITQTWGIIEKKEFEGQVRGRKCKYDFNLTTRTVTTDNCDD